MSNTDIKTMKVSKATNPKSLASAIARELKENKQVIVRAIGLPAVNQAVKGIIIANSFVGQRGKFISVRIGFSNVEISGAVVDESKESKEITSIDFICYEQ